MPPVGEFESDFWSQYRPPGLAAAGGILTP
jgi:hypothetical protein